MKAAASIGMLHKYCSWNDASGVRELLKSRANDIDLIDDSNGGVFTLLISRNYTSILRILIEFYEKRKLQGDPKSTDYRIAYKNLQDTIEAALMVSSKPSEEVNEIIAQYLPTESVYSESMEQTEHDSTNTENDLSGFHSGESLGTTVNEEDNVKSNVLGDYENYPDRISTIEHKQYDNENTSFSLTPSNLSMLGYEPMMTRGAGELIVTSLPIEPIEPLVVSGIECLYLPEYRVSNYTKCLSDNNYKYWLLNILSEKALHDRDLSLCRESINEAMRLVCQNPSEANPEYKARVLYNYIKFTHEPLSSVVNAMSNKEFLYNKLIPQIKRMSEDEGESDISCQFSKLDISDTKHFVVPNDHIKNIISSEEKGYIEHKLEACKDSSTFLSDNNHGLIDATTDLLGDGGVF